MVQLGQFVALNNSRTELEFATPSFTSLAQTPNALQPNKAVHTDSTGANLILVDPSSGGPSQVVGIASSQVAVFQTPAVSDQRLTATSVNTFVFYNITSFTGSGISGIVTQSVVSNIGRINILKAGHINLHFYR